MLNFLLVYFKDTERSWNNPYVHTLPRNDARQSSGVRADPKCDAAAIAAAKPVRSASEASNGRSSASSSARRVNSAAKCASSNGDNAAMRSEEHTSELQSLMRISYAVFCLKKKK